VLPLSQQPQRLDSVDTDFCKIERVTIPSDGPVSVETLLARPLCESPQSVLILCNDSPKEERLESVEVKAALKEGIVAVLPDVRFTGALSLDTLRGKSKALVSFPIAQPYEEDPEGNYDGAWTRNGILWGRPLPGMTTTDLLAVIDFVAEEFPEAPVTLKAEGSVIAGAVFAACLSDNVGSAEIETEGLSFENGSLPLVPGILQYGDIDFWTGMMKA
jgi:hypothetical protein